MKAKYPAAKIKYPWGQWAASTADDGWVTLIKGKDFNVSIRVMRIGALAWARRRGIKCVTQMVDDSTLKVRFGDANNSDAQPVTKRSKPSDKAGRKLPAGKRKPASGSKSGGKPSGVKAVKKAKGGGKPARAASKRKRTKTAK